MKNIVILGSTGSIGKNSLRIIAKFKDKFRVIGVSAYKNIKILENQIQEFNIPVVAIYDKELANKLQKKYPDIEVLAGEKGIKKLCGLKECDMVLNAIIGSSGLKYTLECIYNRKNIALANKESYIMAGEFINNLSKKYNVEIIPVDSEHSAIFHLISKVNKNDIVKYYLTASGGPFLNKPIKEFENITVEETLQHPVWEMGGKITVDSATMINKGFEVIEAHHLFNIDYDMIEVVIHPQSIVHGIIKTKDGEMYAQLSLPDMKYPIMNALSFPEKLENPFPQLDIFSLKELTFSKPDYKKFPLLRYACEVGRKGGNLPAALSIADDIVVEKFLNGRLKFTQIFPSIKKIVESVKYIENPNLEDILNLENKLKEL